MPFSVLRIPKDSGGPVEVVAETSTEEEADRIADEAHSGDTANEFEYVVEPPPSIFDLSRAAVL